MKKILIVALLLFVNLISCSKDDEDISNHPLVGIWEYSVTEQGMFIQQVFNFNVNKTGVMSITLTFEGITETETENFTWSTNNNKLTLFIGDDSEVVNYVISGNKLSITFDGVTIVFTRL